MSSFIAAGLKPSIPEEKTTFLTQVLSTLLSLSKSLQNWSPEEPEAQRSPTKPRGLKAIFKGVQKSKAAAGSPPKDSAVNDENVILLHSACRNSMAALLAVTGGMVPPSQQLPLGKPFYLSVLSCTLD